MVFFLIRWDAARLAVVIFGAVCFDTTRMVCPRLGSVPAGYIIKEPNTNAVDTAGLLFVIMAGLLVQWAVKPKCFVEETEAPLLSIAMFSKARLWMPSSHHNTHYHYLEKCPSISTRQHRTHAEGQSMSAGSECVTVWRKPLHLPSMLDLLLTFTSNLFIYSLSNLIGAHLFGFLHMNK